MELFNGRVCIGYLRNEFYFTPSLGFSFYSKCLDFRFLTLVIMINFGKVGKNEDNELSPAAQAKLDEFFKLLDEENN